MKQTKSFSKIMRKGSVRQSRDTPNRGGGDVDLYTAQTLQESQSERDVYYTHVYKKRRSSLDNILFSQEFYDARRKRVWGFGGLTIENDHLNREDHKSTGSNDHGIVKVRFSLKPVTS